MQEADLYLYDLLDDSYANDEQVMTQLHIFEDSALNLGITIRLTHFSNLVVGIWWLRIAENRAVLKTF